MNESAMKQDVAAGVSLCALRYCQPAQGIEPVSGALILLAVLEAAELRLYAQPSLLPQISEADREYLLDLVEDLLERAQTEPEAVFRQLSTLSSGLLVTDRVCQMESGGAQIEELYPGFILC